jgi:hypothetical protein
MWGKSYKIFFLYILGISFGATAQITNSPYSSYGIGLPARESLGINRGLGNAGIGIRTPQFINTLNPASYSSFDLSVFEAGIISQGNEFAFDTARSRSANASFAYLGFGLPITPWWGLSFGVLPLTTVGYNVVSTQNHPTLGTFSTAYRGTGGVNKIFLGNGFKYRRFSAGVNTNFLFGSVNRDRRVAFDPAITAFNTISIDDNFVNDFDFELGAQYKLPLDTVGRRNLNLGVTYGFRNDLNVARQRFNATFSATPTGDLIRDTVLFESTNTTFTLPDRYGLGLAYTMGDRWLIAADWKYSRWAQNSAFGPSDTLSNSNELNLGIQFTPEEDVLRNMQVYRRIIQYRFGFRYNQSYITLRNTQIQELGITIGVGLPLRRTRIPQLGVTRPSVINIALEAGQRGALEGGLVRERYIMLNLGLTINDRWFQRRRFD